MCTRMKNRVTHPLSVTHCSKLMNVNDKVCDIFRFLSVTHFFLVSHMSHIVSHMSHMSHIVARESWTPTVARES
jgi:hypothetical protein